MMFNVLYKINYSDRFVSPFCCFTKLKKIDLKCQYLFLVLLVDKTNTIIITILNEYEQFYYFETNDQG